MPSDVTGFAGVRVRWTAVPDGAMRRDVAWDLVRTLLPDPSARITNECPRCGGPHGPVHIDRAGVHASVTYAGGFAVVCVADDRAASVGIDAEPETHERRDAAGLTGIVRPGEFASVRDWTRVEAVLKADGRGLAVDPAAVAIVAEGTSWTASVDGSDRAFVGRDVAGPPGIVVSVALEPISGAAAREAAARRATP